MSGIATAIIGGAVISGIASNQAADTAASATQSAASTSADVQRQMFERQVELQEPWRQAGINALAKMQEQYGNMPAAFTGKVDLGQDFGYAFRESEGRKAVERSAAARGGLLGGATLKGIQRFGQDLASQEYQNAYNRALTQYNAAVQREGTGYNRLAALAGVGQTATSALSSAAGQTGANLGNLYYNAGQSAGASRASGYMGVSNALTGGIGTGLNYYQNQQLMNRLLPQQISGGGGGSYPSSWGANDIFGTTSTGLG
jgi:hypothetical protein